VSNWLMVSYHVPNEPSAVRVATWRALKQVGAVKLGDGLYFLPNTEECTAALEELRGRIEGGGGSALTIVARGLSDADEANLNELFAAARSDEFRQVFRSSARLVEHIAREEATDDYRLAEVDALEEELEKVRRQFQRASDRDYLGAPGRDEAANAVSEAAQRMRRYLDEAFRKENGLPARDEAEVSQSTSEPTPLRSAR
jgi:hypothetical protein